MSDKKDSSLKVYIHILIGCGIIYYFYRSGFKLADFISPFLFQYFAVGSGIITCLLRNRDGKSYIIYAILTIALVIGVFSGLKAKSDTNIIEQIRSIPLTLWLVIGLGGCVGYHFEKNK